MDINLTVSAFRVDGDLVMGSRTCPILRNIAITFYGSRNGTSDPVLGQQGHHDYGGTPRELASGTIDSERLTIAAGRVVTGHGLRVASS